MEGAPTTSTLGRFHYVDRASIPADGLRFTLDQQWSGIPDVEVDLPVTDATALADQPRLNREGFQAISLGIDPVDPRSNTEIESRWRPSVLEEVQRVTGADTVVSWSSGARYSEKQKDAPRTDVSNPARRVHGDFAPSEFGQRIIHRPALDMIEPVLRGRPLARWHGLNVWQAVSRPPYDTPLAFCDLRTVAPDDLVIGRGRIPSMPELELDLPLFAHNPEHRWYYWSHMAMDEALVFSGLESNATGTWRMVPHTAFDNRDCPADAPPRNSVETRCMALWFA